MSCCNQMRKRLAFPGNRTHLPWLQLPVLRPLSYRCPFNHRPSTPPFYTCTQYCCICSYCHNEIRKKRWHFLGIEPTSLWSSCQCIDDWATNAQPPTDLTSSLIYIYIYNTAAYVANVTMKSAQALPPPPSQVFLECTSTVCNWPKDCANFWMF